MYLKKVLNLRINFVIVTLSLSCWSGYIGGYGSLSESGLCVFRELCPVSFLVVGECPSVLLLSVVMSYVNFGDDG